MEYVDVLLQPRVLHGMYNDLDVGVQAAIYATGETVIGLDDADAKHEFGKGELVGSLIGLAWMPRYAMAPGLVPRWKDYDMWRQAVAVLHSEHGRLRFPKMQVCSRGGHIIEVVTALEYASGELSYYG